MVVLTMIVFLKTMNHAKYYCPYVTNIADAFFKFSSEIIERLHFLDLLQFFTALIEN